jgi:YggT family protein
LYQLTDPILEPFKRLSNRFLGGNQMVDWSPLIAMLVIQYFIQPLVLTLIGVFF